MLYHLSTIIINNMDKIKITYKENVLVLTKGTTIREVIGNSFDDYDKNPIVGATLSGEMVALSYPLVADGTIQPIHLFSPMGKRIYRHSICFLLSYAISTLYPDKHLIIGHSLGDGFYFAIKLTDEEIKETKAFMRDVVRRNLPISTYPLSYNAASSYFDKRSTKQTKLLLNSQNDNYINTYKLGSFLDTSYEPLVDYTRVLSTWDIQKYEDGLLIRYPQSRDYTKLQTFKDNPLLFKVFKNGHYKEKVLNVECIGALNNKIEKGEVDEVIELEEALMNRNISDIAAQINNKDNTRVVTIAGPSSSGKTTFSLKLCTQLKLLGYHCIKISLDDYYLTKDKIPLDKNGEKDFEALEALDLELLREQITALIDGKSVKLPHFNFKENRRFFDEHETSLTNGSLLILEGIHGLNPALLPTLDKTKVFKIYISALTSVNIDDHNRISTTDNRIIRRIVRDNRTRGTSATNTLSMWPSVEEGEKNHIFPFQNEADAMYNSAHTYELAVLAPFAQSLLRSVKPEAGQAYTTARRLLQFLTLFYPITEKEIPSNSLVREFIGGSIYKAI